MVETLNKFKAATLKKILTAFNKKTRKELIFKGVSTMFFLVPI